MKKLFIVLGLLLAHLAQADTATTLSISADIQSNCSLINVSNPSLDVSSAIISKIGTGQNATATTTFNATCNINGAVIKAQSASGALTGPTSSLNYNVQLLSGTNIVGGSAQQASALQTPQALGTITTAGQASTATLQLTFLTSALSSLPTGFYMDNLTLSVEAP